MNEVTTNSRSARYIARNTLLPRGLFDLNLLINRTLVYGALTVIIAAIYILAVGYLAILFEEETGNLLASVLVAGLIAVLFQPLRVRLQGMVNRLMYGERDNPYAVLTYLGQRLEATLASEAVLPTIIETVAQALKLPYAAIALKQGEALTLAATYGSPPASDPARLALIYQGETIGQLLLAPRTPDDSFSPADWRLLQSIAHQAGVAAHAVSLTTDLRRSRERLVNAREEERRRLQRDLHDGLGPVLAGLTLKLDVARNLLTRNPAAAENLLLELKANTQATIVEIRRLVYDLRPLALDQLGLVAAIRKHAATYDNFNGLHISIEAPEHLPSLPAAVEVATYRIAQEALTNVASHAQAQTCLVRLQLDKLLCLEIMDDGLGLPSHCRAGVGLTSMSERAAELGGTCVIERAPTGGTLCSGVSTLKEFNLSLRRLAARNIKRRTQLMIDPIRVLIADDHPVFRDGLRALLNSLPELIEFVGEAASGEEAIAQAAALQPDMIMMDIQMPGVNGVEATRRIIYTSPHISVIMLTMFEDDDSVFAAIRAGARGYIMKGADQTEILRAIEAVSHGDALFGPAIAERLMNFFAAPRPLAPPLIFPDLTPREREILNLIAQGYNNTEIAERLSLSSKTVRNHISNIFSKLQVADRAQAIVRAREAGLGIEDR